MARKVKDPNRKKQFSKKLLLNIIGIVLTSQLMGLFDQYIQDSIIIIIVGIILGFIISVIIGKILHEKDLVTEAKENVVEEIKNETVSQINAAGVLIANWSSLPFELKEKAESLHDFITGKKESIERKKRNKELKLWKQFLQLKQELWNGQGDNLRPRFNSLLNQAKHIESMKLSTEIELVLAQI